MLKLKLQYFGHLRPPDVKRWLIGKTLMLGKIEGRRRGDDSGWYGWMASLTQWAWVWVSSGSWWWTGRPGVVQFMGSQRVGHDSATELNWTEITADDDCSHEIKRHSLEEKLWKTYRKYDTWCKIDCFPANIKEKVSLTICIQYFTGGFICWNEARKKIKAYKLERKN